MNGFSAVTLALLLLAGEERCLGVAVAQPCVVAGLPLLLLAESVAAGGVGLTLLSVVGVVRIFGRVAIFVGVALVDEEEDPGFGFEDDISPSATITQSEESKNIQKFKSSKDTTENNYTVYDRKPE